MSYTYKKAREDSITKWKYRVKHGYLSIMCLLDEHPELTMLTANCGFCEFFNTGAQDCERENKCPMISDGLSCYDAQHPFRVHWTTPSKENAQKVLDLVLASKEPEDAD